MGPAAGAFGASTEPSADLLARSLASFAASPNVRGPLADALASAGSTMVDVNRAVAPLYAPALVDPQPAHDLELAARLINSGLGSRVLTVTCVGYDTHASQLGWHARLLANLDAGLARFFTVLSPAYAGRVCVLVVSEFGRAPKANASAGTDHGTAGLHLLLGARVRGGRHGATPSLTDLSRLGRERVSVDQRSVFATVLSRWLAADDRQVLGATYPSLDLFTGPPDPAPVDGLGAAGDLPRAGRIVALTPARLLDTREAGGGAGRVRPDAPVELIVAGVGGVPPAGVSSVVLNVTATEPSTAGYVTVWPTGSPRPLASNLNVMRGDTVPNLVVAAVGDGGKVSLFSSAASAHLVVDVVAFAGDVGGGTLVPVTPTRLVDTRLTGVRLTAGVPLVVPVAGRSGVPAVGVVGVVANVTVTEPTAAGYLTAWPAGEVAPLASNLNFVGGQTVPNLVLVKLRDGAMALQASASAHILVDVCGYLVANATGVELRAAVPVRVLDTRDPGGTGAPVGPGATVAVPTAAAVPPDATAVLLNVTAVDPTVPGFVTAWSGAVDRPVASTLNLVPGRVVANLAVVPLDASGRCALYNSAGQTHLVADVMGWFA